MAKQGDGDSELPEVTITTDGAARGNPGPGGWAALLEFKLADGAIHEKLVVGEDSRKVTNNAMEVMGVAGGLAALKRPCQVLLRIDSQYVIGTLERILRGWTPSIGMQNGEQWVQLAEAAQSHNITIEWVRGHAGDVRNERVDEAATAAANRAYEQAEAERRAQYADADSVWTIALCSPGANPAVTWLIRTPAGERRGEVRLRGRTENTTMWASLIEALETAQSLTQGQAPVILIQTNLELLVKQGRGEWKVKAEDHKPFHQRLIQLRPSFQELRFEWLKTEALQALMGKQVSMD